SQLGTFSLRPSMIAATTKVTVTSQTGQCVMRASAKRLSGMKDLQAICTHTPDSLRLSPEKPPVRSTIITHIDAVAPAAQQRAPATRINVRTIGRANSSYPKHRSKNPGHRHESTGFPGAAS